MGAPSVVLESVPDGIPAIVGMCAKIREQINKGKQDFAVLGRWTDAALAAAGEKNDLAELGAILSAVKSAVRYRRDPFQVDTVRSPALTLQRGAGDCDDMTALIGAACEHVGFPVRIVVTGAAFGDWKHVYPEAFARRLGRWIAMDATEKARPLGWRAPLARGVYQEEDGMIHELRGLSGVEGFYSGPGRASGGSTTTTTSFSDFAPMAPEEKLGLSLATLGLLALGAWLLLVPPKKKRKRSK